MNITFLIVDDSSLVRASVKSILSATEEFMVIGEAKNGQEALEFIETTTPDFIILDIEMPIMDGLTFLKHARLKCTSKIIVLSSVATMGSKKSKMARLFGAHAVISKPSGAISFDLEEKRGSVLMNTINALKQNIR